MEVFLWSTDHLFSTIRKTMPHAEACACYSTETGESLDQAQSLACDVNLNTRPAPDDHPDDKVHMNCRDESGQDDDGIGPQDPGGKRVNEKLHCLTIRRLAQPFLIDPTPGSGKAEGESFFFRDKSIIEICEPVTAKAVVNMPVYACVGHPDPETRIKARP